MHEVAQAVAPDARIVYVDNDPIVLDPRPRAADQQRGGPHRVHRRRPARLDAILGSPALRATIDLDQPVALLLIAVMHLVGDDDDPYGIVRRLLDAAALGQLPRAQSPDRRLRPGGVGEHRRDLQAQRRHAPGARPGADVERFFDGLELVEPGVRVLPAWRPDNGAEPPTDAQVSVYGGVARKP